MSQVTSEDEVVRQLQHKLLSGVPKERLAELDRMTVSGHLRNGPDRPPRPSIYILDEGTCGLGV